MVNIMQNFMGLKMTKQNIKENSSKIGDGKEDD